MKIGLHFKPRLTKTHLFSFLKTVFWFSLGAILGLFFFASFVYFFYQRGYAEKVYQGIFVDGHNFSGATEEQVKLNFTEKNKRIQNSTFTFKSEDFVATISAKELSLGYDADLLSHQAFSIGRSNNLISNISLIFQAYVNGINLPAAYTSSDDVLEQFLLPLRGKVDIAPVDALFTFQNGRVVAFRPSQPGRTIDEQEIKQQLHEKIFTVISSPASTHLVFKLPINTVEPEVTTDKANDLGIKELLGTGISHFVGSIPNRAFNISLAGSRLNGILIPPNEVFSFNKALGDISAFTGYKQAYVIQNGRTVLGDGGGVCQVSTTFFRAILAAGLPIVERNPHAYRVSYYEQDSAPGIDAAIYVPSVDLKFRNDTGHSILVQTAVDENNQQLTFELYGTKDNREVTISKPVILSQTPAPEPLYQDDPNLPKGTVKQVDFAAVGAHVYFTREVKKNGKVIISDRFDSFYRPWQAIYLRGTKE